VLIRPSKGGLILQTMFYANEIRDFSEIAKAEGVRLSAAEFELANSLTENCLPRSSNRIVMRMNIRLVCLA
jgi:non-homologous end joining protein Ku